MKSETTKIRWSKKDLLEMGITEEEIKGIEEFEKIEANCDGLD